MRADQLLVQRHLAATRSQAQRLIAAGVQWRVAGGGWQAVRKNGDELPADAELQLQDEAEARYVSRGGLKLEGALRAIGLDVTGLRCLDVGQSTGGFTDCLLQQGAAHVTGLDVGQGQLHPVLRADARVTAHEKVNARDRQHLQAVLGTPPSAAPSPDGPRAPAVLPLPPGEGSGKGSSGQGDQAPDAMPAAHHAPTARPFALIVGDVSFISQTLVLPAVLPYLAPGGHLLMLVKPQFELQPAQIGKGGLVKEPALYAEVEQRIRACCVDNGLQVLHWLDSPIAGGDGNREFLVHGVKPAHP